MARPNVTLQPSKSTLTAAAAQIYAAYIASGRVQDDDVDTWIERCVREAVAIARKIDGSVQSDEELPDNGKQRLRRVPEDEDAPEIAPPS